MIYRFKCFGALAFAILVAVPGFCQNEAAQAEILNIMQQHEAVGLSVVVVKEGAVQFSRAFGLKDIENNTVLSEKDLFRIASISKSFTATAMMQLVEDKKISLDDDFSKLVGFSIRNPKFPDKVITLRMVLSHTSSINDSQGYFGLDVIDPAKNTNWAKCYNDYEPGKGYQYCNLNFNMAGTALERLSGVRFDVHIRNQILRPLGLYGGYCIDSLDHSLFTTLYEYDSGRFIPAPMAYAARREEIANYTMGYSTPVFSPTGGMKISARDLTRYMMMHMNYGETGRVRIISRKSAKTLQKPVATEEGYGLALETMSNLIPGKAMIGHTGTAYGLYSAMFFHPKEKFGFVVITNGCQPSYTDGMNTLLKSTIQSLYKNFIQQPAEQ